LMRDSHVHTYTGKRIHRPRMCVCVHVYGCEYACVYVRARMVD